MTPVEKLTEESLTDEQMAKLEGITVETLRNRISAGKNHPPYTGKGKSRRFPVDEYRKWKKSQLVYSINRAS